MTSSEDNEVQPLRLFLSHGPSTMLKILDTVDVEAHNHSIIPSSSKIDPSIHCATSGYNKSGNMTEKSQNDDSRTALYLNSRPSTMLKILEQLAVGTTIRINPGDISESHKWNCSCLISFVDCRDDLEGNGHGSKRIKISNTVRKTLLENYDSKTGCDELDLKLVMQQTGQNRQEAVKALIYYEGDIVNAIMHLSE